MAVDVVASESVSDVTMLGRLCGKGASKPLDSDLTAPGAAKASSFGNKAFAGCPRGSLLIGEPTSEAAGVAFCALAAVGLSEEPLPAFWRCLASFFSLVSTLILIFFIPVVI